MQNRQIYSFDDFRLDTGNRQLLRDGKPLPLSAKAFDLLQTLLAHKGRLVEKDELFNAVWRDRIVEESNLTVHVSQIRKALGESRNNPRYIETVPGFGYRFVGNVSDTEDDELVIETRTFSRITVENEQTNGAEPNGHDDSFLTHESKHRSLPASAAQRHRVLQIVLGSALVLLVIGLVFWRLDVNQNRGAVSPPVSAERQTQIKRLTSKGTVNYGALSPDGNFFAYSLQERGNSRTSLWLGQTDGNSDLQLLPASQVTYNPRSISADGNWLYYTASEPRGFDSGTLYKIPVLGGVPQKLLSGISVFAVVSPDEKQIAFVRSSRKKKTESLVLLGLDGSEEREITFRAAGHLFNDFSLTWSPDGRMVAFAAEVGNEQRREIFAVNIADGSVRQITSLEWINISRIDWLRDSSGFATVARAKNGFAANQLWLVDYESGKAQKVTNDLQHYGSTLSLSASSNELVAVQAIVESNIWIAPAEDLANARQLTFGSSGHEGWHGIDWSPDGRIIYTARVDQSLTLWSTDTSGENPKQLTSAGFLDQRPSMTPDGKYIVFQSNRSGATEIWRVNPDGSDLRQITSGGKNSLPHSMPDGRTIVYTHNSEGVNSAWRVSIEGGNAVQISDAQCSNARVSPDGNFVACGSGEGEESRLAILAVTGGQPIKLFDVPATHNFDYSIRWTSDGKSITYRDWANGVWSQPVNGGEPTRISGLPAEKLYTFESSLDGKQAAFTRGREVRDIVLIRNFR